MLFTVNEMSKFLTGKKDPLLDPILYICLKVGKLGGTFMNIRMNALLSPNLFRDLP
jgi:hypothetical protein